MHVYLILTHFSQITALLGTARLFIFDQNSSLHAYLGMHNIFKGTNPPIWIKGHALFFYTKQIHCTELLFLSPKLRQCTPFIHQKSCPTLLSRFLGPAPLFFRGIIPPTRLFGSYTLIYQKKFFLPARLFGHTRLIFWHLFSPLHGYLGLHVY